MCGKPEVNSSLVADEEDESNSSSSENPEDNGNANSNSNKRNETPEEKRRRRKLERRQRKRAKQEQKGKLVLASNQSAPRKLMTLFNTVWDNETQFVTSQVLACLPEVRQPGLQLDDEERTDEYLNQWDDAGDDKKEKEKTQKFFAKVRRNLISQGVAPQTERAKSYQELRERLHRKIAELAQKPNVEKREKKQKRKLKRAEEKKSNKGKKLISQSASTAGASKEDKDGGIKSETSEKTPLTKKPVVKSNGEIVYSKFDFISTDSRSKSNGIVSMSDSLMQKKSKGKPTPEELLKKAEKHEKQISSLATHGKKSEAADLASSQKWETALKRAEGQKIRDDPHLLKKTIKKNEKLKQATKKKWKERVERVEKQKELRQQKRQTNIEGRRDEKKKRIKKLMRKRGRIA